jgi:bifunctional non-homologous end joining protein LigD
MASIILYYSSGSSDKEYRLQLQGDGGRDNWAVAFQYGRRGNAGNSSYKIRDTHEAKARQVFEKFIREKVREGYTLDESGQPGSTTIEQAIATAYDRPANVHVASSVFRRRERALEAVEARAARLDELRAATPEESSLHTGQVDMDMVAPTPEPEDEVTPVRRILWSGLPKNVSVPQTQTITTDELLASLLAQQPNPIDETSVDQLIHDLGWGMQDKYDGKHISVRVRNGRGQAFNKKGEPTNIPQTVMDGILAARSDLEVDGELIGQRYVAYDLLSFGNTGDLRGRNYKFRHECLAMVKDWTIEVAPLYTTREAKRERFEYLKSVKANGEAHGEGVVFKRLSAVFTVGRPAAGGDMLKYKFWATCSCIVAQGRDGKRSVALMLLGPDSTTTTIVGNCTISNKKVDGQLIPVPEVGDIVEIRYLYAYRGGSLYQPTYIGPRDDVSADECLMSQLKYKAEA